MDPTNNSELTSSSSASSIPSITKLGYIKSSINIFPNRLSFLLETTLIVLFALIAGAASLTSFSWSMEDHRYYSPLSYYPYRGVRSHSSELRPIASSSSISARPIRGHSRNMTTEEMVQYIDRVTRGDLCHSSNAKDLHTVDLGSVNDLHNERRNHGEPSSMNGYASSLYGESLTSSSSSSSGPTNSGSSSSTTDRRHHLLYASSPSRDIPPLTLRNKYNQTSARVDLLNAILTDYKPSEDGYRLLKKSFHEMVNLDKDIIHARIIWLSEADDDDDVDTGNRRGSSSSSSGLSKQLFKGDIKPVYYYTAKKKRAFFSLNINRTISPYEPWFDFSFENTDQERIFHTLLTQRSLYVGPRSVGSQREGGNNGKGSSRLGNGVDSVSAGDGRPGRLTGIRDESTGDGLPIFSSQPRLGSKCPKFANWTNAYYSCDYEIWLFSYTSLIILESIDSCLLRGIISVDIDINRVDINQCDYSSSSEITIPLFGTHKCHQPSSKCTFQPGHGWSKGGYECECRDGYFAPSASFTGDQKRRSFNGTEVEKAWAEKLNKQGSVQYDMIYVCQRCSEGCETCSDSSACLSSYNWAFRISLLTVSILCIFLTGLLACYIYKYRKLKVFKVASPIFLCITLLGCAIMYSEMAAIFPVLTTSACIATKFTRHMGFCITYSALLLKTWRVSLTYRVKSAHKLKLTDKQLLQWLFPILLVMAIYLGTWTISAPPQPIYITDWNALKFKICEYNWWDHSLAIMEFLFLLWGIKVCYNVRNAESFFNEAKYITWAIYNIAIVNILMISIHLLILPNAGPDGKYFFGFVRTQLSTTTTIMLIFGPKFYRVIKGQGDSWDNRVRARGVNASFSLNGVGLVHEETTDLYQENEELKEEIHKLATQIELMKLMQMEINNRHLKPKHTGSGHHILPTVTITANPASAGSVSQSPIVKAVYSRFDANDAPSPRISPAAELASERV